MIFDALYESALRGELLLVDGGLCHFHLRRDGQLTIREIIAHPPGCGVGTAMLERLKAVPGARFLLAKCPIDLEANRWYAARGFALVAMEQTGTGRLLNVWVLGL